MSRQARTERSLARQVVGAVGRITVVTTLLLVGYFQLPTNRDTTLTQVAIFTAGMIGFGVVLVFQIRRIVNDVNPRLRAVETIGTALPVFIVIFSLTYVVLAQNDPASFGQPVNRITGLYFTITVLATVGFGDVAAKTDLARIFVTIQMVLDLILVGVVAKVVVGASRVGVERRRAEAATGEPSTVTLADLPPEPSP